MFLTSDQIHLLACVYLSAWSIKWRATILPFFMNIEKHSTANMTQMWWKRKLRNVSPVEMSHRFLYDRPYSFLKQGKLLSQLGNLTKIRLLLSRMRFVQIQPISFINRLRVTWKLQYVLLRITTLKCSKRENKSLKLLKCPNGASNTKKSIIFAIYPSFS